MPLVSYSDYEKSEYKIMYKVLKCDIGVILYYDLVIWGFCTVLDLVKLSVLI